VGASAAARARDRARAVRRAALGYREWGGRRPQLQGPGRHRRQGRRSARGPRARSLLDPEAFDSSPFLRIPETVENIIFAASNELQIDLEPRYEEATTSCIVEFAAPPDDFDQALAAACWYVEAAIRGDAAGPDVHWNFSGDGTAVPPQDIVFVKAGLAKRV
jgi:hypothetical protein